MPPCDLSGLSPLPCLVADVMNVYFLAQFVTILFAILGVSLLSGMFLRCNNPAVRFKDQCVGTFLDPVTGVNTTARWSNPSYAEDSRGVAYSFDDFVQVRGLAGLTPGGG